ncbi:hypothetical protein [Eubacterium xylanophilum]|uniref:hypothetical protein n=1 Tax=Eubacterium xylanophilum TaxID=39497 RepID=UPI0004B557DA|nr:hypothetical protein [Eubacterium xylanophilum]
MIFWYKDLIVSSSLSGKEKVFKRDVEKRSVFAKLPFKRSYYIICLAENSDNLLEIIPTDQMFFKYYGVKDIYIVGIAKTNQEAVELVSSIVSEGYEKDIDFDVRSYYPKKDFCKGKK